MVYKKGRISKTIVKAASRSEAPCNFIHDVREILRQARGKAYAAANFIMVEAYWRIGRRIVQEEQGGKNRADYGSFLIREVWGQSPQSVQIILINLAGIKSGERVCPRIHSVR